MLFDTNEMRIPNTVASPQNLLGMGYLFVMVLYGTLPCSVECFVILTTHSYFLKHDAKQVARMAPYSPLSTLIATALLEGRGHSVAHFDSTFAEGIGEFEMALDHHRPWLVAIMEDNFNFLTKMCTVRRRQDTLSMIAAATKRAEELSGG